MRKLLFFGLITSNIIFAQDTIKLSVKQDAFVHSAAPDYNNTNYGKNEQLPADSWTFSSQPGNLYSLIQFDFSSIPTNRKIEKVVLSLKAWGQESGIGPHSALTKSNDFAFYKITSTWDENTVTWTTKPSYDMNLTSKQPGTNDPNKDYNDIDLTELTKDMLATQNYGYLMKLINDEYYSKMNFCSSDHNDITKRPELTVILSKIDADTLVLSVKQDAFIHSAAPDYFNTNYGKDEQLPADSWTFSSQPGNLYSLIQFDLSSIPTNRKIEKVVLSLKAWGQESGIGPHSALTKSNDFAFYKVTSTWDENTVTWTIKPSYDMNLTSKQPGTNEPDKDYNDIDLTELTKDMLATQNYGYLMKLVNDEYYSKMNFCSSDHKDVSKRPVLKVVLGDQTADVEKIAQNHNIDIFPNPTTGLFNLKVQPAMIGKSYSITDITGKLILTSKINNINENLNIDNFEKGTYFLQLEGESTLKIIKE